MAEVVREQREVKNKWMTWETVHSLDFFTAFRFEYRNEVPIFKIRDTKKGHREWKIKWVPRDSSDKVTTTS